MIRRSLERSTPVLMIGASERGKEILHPAAVTMLRGLITATLLDTFPTPLPFHRFGQPWNVCVIASRN